MNEEYFFYSLSDGERSIIDRYYEELKSDVSWKASHKYRLLCDARIVRLDEFEAYLDGDEKVIPHNGLPPVSLNVPLDGAVAAICVNDYTTATMLGLIIQDYKLEVAENA